MLTHAVSVIFLPGHEHHEEADHEAGHSHGEGGQGAEREILGQKVSNDSGDDCCM